MKTAKQIEIVKKGYTITVESWENDGDYYNTKTIVVDTYEEAATVNKVFNDLFSGSSWQGNYYVSNDTGSPYDLSLRSKLVEYFYENSNMLINHFPKIFRLKEEEITNLLKYETYDSFRTEMDEFYEEEGTELEIPVVEMFVDLAYHLMGSSEYYAFRVCSDITVTYSDETIYCDLIKF